MYASFGGSGGFSPEEIREIQRRSQDRIRNGVVLPRRPKQKFSGRLTGPYAVRNQAPVDPFIELSAALQLYMDLPPGLDQAALLEYLAKK
jgi:hypothetical protein